MFWFITKVRVIDLTGWKFGRLTVMNRAVNSKTGQAYWLCRCDCGRMTTARGVHLRAGLITSCGCYRREICIKHGMHGTSEYKTYYNMIKRCEYENDNRYPDYGGRGIRVCPEWRNSFERFLADMGPKPSKRHSIERLDVNGNYSPANCVWALLEDQEHNKRARKDSPTGIRGVVINKTTGRYVSQIYAGGKTRRIGIFSSLEEAAAARRDAEKRYWGT